MKLDALTNLYRQRQAILRERPRLGDVTDDLWVILRVEAQQRAVMRRHWVEHAECGFAVAVERRWDLANGKDELAARTRRFRGKSVRVKQRQNAHQDQQFSDLFECCKHTYPLQCDR